MSPKGISSKALRDRSLSDVPLSPPQTNHAKKHQGPGRPAVKVDWEKVGEYLRKGLPIADIAALHRCSEDALRRHAEAEGVDITSLTAAKTAEGRDRLLDQIHRHAEKWGPMAIFLSKQTTGVGLGYRDNVSVQHEVTEVRRVEVVLLPPPERPSLEPTNIRELPPAATVEPDQGPE